MYMLFCSYKAEYNNSTFLWKTQPLFAKNGKFIKEEKQRGKTIIYSTHYMEEAENICDKIIFINSGKKVLESTPENVKDKTKTSNLRDAFFAVIGGVYED